MGRREGSRRPRTRCPVVRRIHHAAIDDGRAAYFGDAVEHGCGVALPRDAVPYSGPRSALGSGSATGCDLGGYVVDDVVGGGLDLAEAFLEIVEVAVPRIGHVELMRLGVGQSGIESAVETDALAD